MPQDCKAYQVWGKLSSGGMSDVWLARHRELALPVVIKTIRTDGAIPQDDAYARLLGEARLMARLATPRVVRVVDVGNWAVEEGMPELPFLVEEYVDGVDLGEYERRRRAATGRTLPLWAVASVCAEAARGLHEGHQAGVIHRDVKPSNLFLFGHGEVKVGDFGVAVASVETVHRAEGTPSFMAPEQLAGDTVDRRADVWALGATAFALRYGAPPYRSVADVMSGALPRFPEPRTPEEAYFQHTLARMMAREPGRRHASLLAARHHLAATAATRPRLTATRHGRGAYAIGPTRIVIEVGDITRAPADAIVNSASSELRMRSGTGDAIRRAGGDRIEEAARALAPRALGDCVATPAGSLPYAGVLHAVGGWNEVSCVARATHRAVLLAAERGFRRVAFPAIATGQGRVSLESCADALLGVLVLHATLGGLSLEEVRIVLVDEATHRRFCDVAEGLLFDHAAEHVDELDPVWPESDPSTAQTAAAPPTPTR